MSALASAGPEAGYVVEFIPSFRWLPSWFPGVAFKRDAAVWAPQVAAMAREPFKFVEDAMVSQFHFLWTLSQANLSQCQMKGNARSCVATELLQELDPSDQRYKEKRKVIHSVVSVVYAGQST
jgi:hypothetical protein